MNDFEAIERLTERSLMIMDALSGRPLDAAEIARRCDIPGKSIYIVLTRMVEVGHLQRADTSYSISKLGRDLLAAARSFEATLAKRRSR